MATSHGHFEPRYVSGGAQELTVAVERVGSNAGTDR